MVVSHSVCSGTHLRFRAFAPGSDTRSTENVVSLKQNIFIVFFSPSAVPFTSVKARPCKRESKRIISNCALFWINELIKIERVKRSFCLLVVGCQKSPFAHFHRHQEVQLFGSSFFLSSWCLFQLEHNHCNYTWNLIQTRIIKFAYKR